MRRTKIICTLGPATKSPDMIKRLMEAGMNVARLNFSHGTYAEHQSLIDMIKEQASLLELPVAILLDTKGPEIRTGAMPAAGVTLQDGQDFLLDLDDTVGSAQRTSVSYDKLWQEVAVGSRILLDDGLIELRVVEITAGCIAAHVVHGGLLQSRKGVNVPGAAIHLPALTEKDIEDIEFGLKNDVDFIAASFTRKAADILEVHKVVERRQGRVKIIAKIENRTGVENVDSILNVCDGIMIARGDLGVEIPVEDVPVYQKDIICRCNALGKTAIVATQMLDSMIRKPQPTRAEASDVANAILDGADAIMLSGETASGRFPIEALEMMDRLARRSEEILFQAKSVGKHADSISDAIAHASATIAEDLNAAAIITPTQTGLTSRFIAMHRPRALSIATTAFPQTARMLALTWGVYPIIVPDVEGTDELLSVSVTYAQKKNLIKTGDIVVLTAGVPVGQAGTTNLIKVQVVGKVLARGLGIGRAVISGTANRSANSEGFVEGQIFVASTTDGDDMSVIAKAGALVVEEGGLTSHAAIAALEYKIPAVVAAHDALKQIQEGQFITVDAITGVIYEGAVAML
ncbi:MAG: pyruvate kinase [Peptococcaceae bacterium]|nr:pyruvate kinase [Peptococcaceae bacterium]